MPGWRAKAACAAAAALTAACGHSAPPAPPASAPTGLTPVVVTVPAGLDTAPFDTPRQALVPPGWTMSVWARVPRARLAAWAPDGALLVSVPAAGQVVRLASGQSQPRSTVLLEGLDQPHGLAFDRGTLYVAESDQVDAFDYRGDRADGTRVVADGLPDARSADLGGAYAHALKSVAVGRDGSVYFSIGSTGNITADDRTAEPPRATIMRVPPEGGSPEPFATGVRNGTGLAAAPDGSLWTAVNNRDQVPDPRTGPEYGAVTDYVNDHPPESVARLTPGRELGWPYCNPDIDNGPAFVRDVQTNADGSKLDCAALPPVEQTLGAHSAPLGLSFTVGTLPAPYDSGALVGVHGSWNRTPPRAPEVSFFAWRDGTLGPQQTLVGGFQDQDGSRWGRPVAAVAGPDGAVYITDDYAGAVYRLTPPGRLTS
ncbi:PQQ-dependent sugar dehydrogenase [Mycolicibacterium aichiense]|uniref:Gluconolaconase n=1 Tax=Mycolicibacterium aichiense TaxID=1799 RepID=A0AAD1HT10_9MYCO|nr:gluconolaconase [Mycolicibacterium aichiense]MCV7016962.1 gluconolaconase [Mycolicibacterium aichiense]BBX10615.1 gluconolaconase [Mycolicibacterium aichiense]STZ25729.1 glucose/sorbosone dehydrogenase [Mycolicibacterium aichiense]